MLIEHQVKNGEVANAEHKVKYISSWKGDSNSDGDHDMIAINSVASSLQLITGTFRLGALSKLFPVDSSTAGSGAFPGVQG